MERLAELQGVKHCDDCRCVCHVNEWPRCPDCGARAPTAELLERHRVRRCHGNPDRPALVRLRPQAWRVLHGLDYEGERDQ